MDMRVHITNLFICVVLICMNIQTIMSGNCDIEVQKTFEITRFLGIWHEWMWIRPSYLLPNETFLDFQHDYSLRKNGDISVHIRGRNPAKMDACFDDYAVLRSTSEPGKFTFVRTVAGRVNESSDYWIVKTDYENYAVTYGCRVRRNNNCEEVDSWVWSRSRFLSQQHLKVVKSVIKSICLKMTDYFRTRQSRKILILSQQGLVRHSPCNVMETY